MNFQIIRQNILTIIILLAVLTALIFEQPHLDTNFSLIAILIASILAISYKYEILGFAKILFSIIIIYGSFVFGFIFYMLLPNESVEQSIINHESPPQRFDLFIFGTFLGIFSSFLTILYYFILKKIESTILEKYFSYVLVIGLTMTTIISFLYTL